MSTKDCLPRFNSKWQGFFLRRHQTESSLSSNCRFLVKQSTIANGHFHFYPQDKLLLDTPLLGNGKTKQCIKFSPFGDCLDFCLQTDNGVNLAWIQFQPDPAPRFRVDLNRSGRMAWECPAPRVEADLPWPGLPRLCLPGIARERRFRWMADHPQVSDGLALVDLTSIQTVLGIYSLPTNSVREGFIDFYADEIKTEELILFIMLLSISLATFPKPDTRSAPLTRTSSVSSIGSLTSPTSPTKKKSDLLFERTHVW